MGQTHTDAAERQRIEALLEAHQAGVQKRIAEAQSRSSEQVIALMSLAKADADTHVAESALMDTMETLTLLRKEYQAVVDMRGSFA